jgi:hypothetical protein
MKKLVATIYQYFVFRKLPSPYFRTISLIVFFIMLITLILYGAFPIPKGWMPFSISKRESDNYFYTALFTPLLVLVLKQISIIITLHQQQISFVKVS